MEKLKQKSAYETACVEYLKSYPTFSPEGKFSIGEIITIIEAVKAHDSYCQLPQAVKDSIQPICDRNGIFLTFDQCRRKRIALTGIIVPYQRATYLYTFETITETYRRKKLKNSKDLYCIPDGDHKLFKESEVAEFLAKV